MKILQPIDVLLLNDRPFEVISGGMDVLVLHSRPFDAREQFKFRIVSAIHRFLQRAPLKNIRNRQEDPRWDLGADANLSLISVVLATGLEELGVRYKVWDTDNLLLCHREDVVKDLRKNPKIIAVSSSHFTTEDEFVSFIQFIRKYNRTASLVVGGQLLDICPNIEEQIPEVDYFVYGDGELVFPRLVKAILSNKDTVDDIPGVRYRKNGSYHSSHERDIVDINTVPLPRWDLVLKRDFNNFGCKNSPFLPMVFIEEVRGCRKGCAFCSYPRSTPRMKTADRIISEIRQSAGVGLKHFNIYSALFTSPVRHCREVLERIIRENLNITFSCQARIDDLYGNPDLLDLMKRAGCIHISTGIESGDSEQLKRMKKPLDVKKIPSIVKKIHKLGISLTGNFFIGFPGETKKTIETTYSLLRKCNFSTLYLSAFVVEKASAVFRNRDKYGLEVNEDGRQWRHPTMTSKEAEEQTARLFIKVANDPDLRSVLWVIQWRFARFFTNLLMQAHHPETWQLLRLLQKGVANELEFALDNKLESGHIARQNRLWKRILSGNILLREGE